MPHDVSAAATTTMAEFLFSAPAARNHSPQKKLLGVVKQATFVLRLVFCPIPHVCRIAVRYRTAYAQGTASVSHVPPRIASDHYQTCTVTRIDAYSNILRLPSK